MKRHYNKKRHHRSPTSEIKRLDDAIKRESDAMTRENLRQCREHWIRTQNKSW